MFVIFHWKGNDNSLSALLNLMYGYEPMTSVKMSMLSYND